MEDAVNFHIMTFSHPAWLQIIHASATRLLSTSFGGVFLKFFFFLIEGVDGVAG
jgi:hypothetical protein